jgi:hypothetical protein
MIVRIKRPCSGEGQAVLDRRRRDGGFALMLVLAFLAVSMLVVGGLLSWTSQNAWMTQRHQDYHGAVAVQNVAGELLIARMRADLRDGGVDGVVGQWNTYPNRIILELEDDPYWDDHEFAIQIDPWPGPGAVPGLSPLLGTHGGLVVTNQEFVIKSGARWLGTTPPVAAAVEEWVQVAEIPIFAFAALYDFDLSFITPPGENIVLNGRVHSNRDIYTYPSGTMTFGDHVTSARTNYPSLHPNDLATRQQGTAIYEKANDGRVGRMQVPGGGDNPRAMIEAAYLQLADLIITVSDFEVYATRGLAGADISDYTTNFVSTNALFLDRREVKTVQATELDIGYLPALLGGPPAIVYVEDVRTQGVDTMPGVRLINGYHLPSDGLIVVTPNPLYVRGDYNAGTKQPAALVADAITILSDAWSDDELTITIADPTIVRAAILTGIIPSEAGSFDGGFFNGLRLLEDWRGRTLTFNGSVVALYRSEQALEPWRADVSIYFAPIRQWSFDPDFLDPNYLPWTPVVCTLVRLDWSLIDPGPLFAD